MPDFPELGCHAFAQYPSSHQLVTPAVVQHYVDGSEQRFAETIPAHRVWIIRLQRVSEADAVRLRNFFHSVAANASSFRFRDPWTGTWYETCWFRTDSLSLDHSGDNHFATDIEIYAEDE